MKILATSLAYILFIFATGFYVEAQITAANPENSNTHRHYPRLEIINKGISMPRNARLSFLSLKASGETKFLIIVDKIRPALSIS